MKEASPNGYCSTSIYFLPNLLLLLPKNLLLLREKNLLLLREIILLLRRDNQLRRRDNQLRLRRVITGGCVTTGGRVITGRCVVTTGPGPVLTHLNKNILWNGNKVRRKLLTSFCLKSIKNCQIMHHLKRVGVFHKNLSIF